jgi:hypothetical protein
MSRSEWKVQSNPINGEILFIPYRIRDTSQPVHGGNVEHPEGCVYSRDEAQVKALVEELNRKERGNDK